MSSVAIDPRLIAWQGRDGLRYRCVERGGALIFKPRIGSLRDLVVWASGKTNYYITKLVNQFYNATAYSFPTTHYWAGWTTTLSAASTGSSGTESAYTGYTRVTFTVNNTNYSTSSAGSSITNSVAITWPANAGSLSTWTYVAICDASTAGNMLFFGSITSTAINAGDTPVCAASALTASEA